MRLFPAQNGVSGLGKGGIGLVLLAATGLLLVGDLVADGLVLAMVGAVFAVARDAGLVADVVRDVLLLLRLVLLVGLGAHGRPPSDR